MIKSPLNYTGGKFKLLPEIFSVVPKDSKVLDLFCGGLNVSLNVRKSRANDTLTPLILLYESLKKLPKAYILGYIARTHTRFDMTTKEGYLSLREKYNKSKYPLDLLLLAFSSFTNYIRFNSKGEFNMPYGRGKRCITEKQYLNLVAMIDKLSDIDFLNKDFADVDPHPDEFVYCDPPYLLANATYNSGWSDKDEKRLLDYLWDIKDTNNFALSNVTHHKGLENKRLIRFMRSFNTLKVDIHYGRCNYQSKMSNTVEVIVHNVNK